MTDLKYYVINIETRVNDIKCSEFFFLLSFNSVYLSAISSEWVVKTKWWTPKALLCEKKLN